MNERTHDAAAQTWVQVHIGRPGYVMAFLGLLAASFLYFAGSGDASRGILTVVFVLLLALPVVNLAAILVEEAGRGGWLYVAMASVVIVILGARIFVP